MKNTEKVVKALMGMRGALLRNEIADRCGLSGSKVSSALTSLVKTEKVIVHQGDTPHKNGYTLNPEKITDDVAGKAGGKARAPKTMRDILLTHTSTGLAQRHISTTLVVLEEAIDAGDEERIGQALVVHKQAVELAGI